MVNEKQKNVRKKPVGRAEGSSKKTTVKKKNSVKKKETVKETVVKKKNAPVKKTKTSSSKEKKSVAKKVIKKPAVKSKPKAIKKPVTKKRVVKESVKKDLKRKVAGDNRDLKIEKASKTQIEKVESVIDKLSQAPERRYVTTVPGVLRKVPSVQEAVPAAHHKELPIAGIINYLKKIF